MEDAASVPASIIIITCNRLADLEECLASLPWEEIAARGIEVVLVSDGCTDRTEAYVAEHYPQILVLSNPAPTGVAKARNKASQAASGDLLLYIDDDVVVCPGWLSAMLERHDGASVLGGRILNYSDGRQQAGPAFSTFIGKRLPCRPENATVGTGCNLGTARAVFDAVGGFDEELNFFEDSFFCICARRAGFKFQYAADAVVRHKGTPRKIGEKITKQEFSSTYAMLKTYRGSPLRIAAFTVLNGAWLVIRIITWTAKGRSGDVKRLVTGWRQAYRAFARGGPDRTAAQ